MLQKDGKFVYFIWIDEIVPESEPEPEPFEDIKGKLEIETRSKYCLLYLNANSTGKQYISVNGGYSKYNSTGNYIGYDSESNYSKTGEELFNLTGNAEANYSSFYAYNHNTNAIAIYTQVQEIKVVKYTYDYGYDTLNGVEVPGTYWETKRPGSGVVLSTNYVKTGKTKTKTITPLNGSYIIKNPEYQTKQWVDLTSEEFVYDTTLTGIPNITDYKSSLKPTSSSDKLDMSLISGKDAGDVFTLLSDNNPKSFSLEFDKNSIFGVTSSDIPFTKSTDLYSQYLHSKNFIVGPLKNEETNSTISLDVFDPTSSKGTGEYTEQLPVYGFKNEWGDSNYKFDFDYRSIKYNNGVEIGDSDGCNYWYTTLRIARLNNVGYNFKFTAPNQITSDQFGNSDGDAIITNNSSRKNNNLYLTATFVQPILTGKIKVNDVAGYVEN